MKVKYLSSILVLFLLTLAFGCVAPAAPLVTRVIDGDTIEVDIGGTIYKVRYIGIDTPELDDERPEYCALAQEATRYNRQLVEGKTVRLEKDISETDRYERLLRYVYVDDIFVNAELVRQGLAWANVYEPDTRYQDILKELEMEAEQAGRGLWATPLPLPPIRVENVKITYIFYDGLVAYVESDEYVEITGIETAFIIASIMVGSAIRATPPIAHHGASTRLLGNLGLFGVDYIHNHSAL